MGFTEDSAAFIDLHIDYGLMEAVKSYPIVALAVLFIPDETENYVIVIRLIREEGRIKSVFKYTAWILFVRLAIAVITMTLLGFAAWYFGII